MQNVEPMMMGSPGSPLSPIALHNQSALNQSAFLPAYLMGEPSPMHSPVNRMWSSTSLTSPNKPLSAVTSKNVMTSPNSSHNLSAYSPATRTDHRSRELIGRGKDKSGAPPVSGLLQNTASPMPTPDRLRGFDSRNTSLHGSFMGTPQQVADLHTSQLYTSAPSTPNTVNTSHMNTSHMYTQHNKTSPAQIDPFYTQGESIKPDDELNEQWITIFGFPSAATSFILQQFSQYGNILKHVVSPEGNWLHIKYQSRLQAKKALSKNGKVFGSSIMVGVNPCIDKSVMDSDADSGHTSLLSTPTQPVVNCGSTQHTPIRPLTAAYKAATTEHDVVHKSNTPQKNANIISKAVEYMFGW